MIKEDFLYYIWKLRRFNCENLELSDGSTLIIENPGEHNTNSGPDFFNARIRIDGTLWFGNIEIHVYSSDWEKHSHQDDPAYNNVILHVVYEHDQDVSTSIGSVLPCLELKPRINKSDVRNYKMLRYNRNWIPCEQLISSVSQISKTSAIEKSITQRLATKAERLQQILDKTKNDWSESFYIYLSRYFGMNINADAFEMLALSCPLKMIKKEKDDLLKIEALMFGQAGMLQTEFKDEYPDQLKSEYNHLKIKYDLKPVPVSIWKYSKLRPYNFPSVRIAQLAGLLWRNADIFEKAIQQKSIEQLRELFKSNTSPYWAAHFNFEKRSRSRIKKIGTDTIDVFIINTVVPAIFLYGHLTASEHHKELALKILSEIAPEKNSIITKWQTLGLVVESGFDSQALIEMKTNYCSKHKCLECPIGHEIMKRS
jgi:hypothetical protein